MASRGLRFLSSAEASALDEALMSEEHGFSLDQLMELAGLSVASAVADAFGSTPLRVLVLAGPGNNGGDGLVAARHLAHWGYRLAVCLPKQTDKPLYAGLRRQLERLSVPFVPVEEVLSAPLHEQYDVLIDALFGFSFKGVARPPFDLLLTRLTHNKRPPIVSVDLPSGWSVDDGDVRGDGIKPDVIVSLSAPKLGVRAFAGRHYLGGRFLPPGICERFQLNLPTYPGTAQCMRLW